MTRKADPDAEFVRFGSYKMELNKKVMESFSEACDYLGVKRTDVMRHLLMEFVDKVRDTVMKKAKRELVVPGG